MMVRVMNKTCILVLDVIYHWFDNTIWICRCQHRHHPSHSHQNGSAMEQTLNQQGCMEGLSRSSRPDGNLMSTLENQFLPSTTLGKGVT